MGDDQQVVTAGVDEATAGRVRSPAVVSLPFVPVAPPEGRPAFAVPGMVLLAALSVFQGYQWLQIIPGGSLRPAQILFAVAVAPLTVWLTRRVTSRRTRVLKRAALVWSVAVTVLSVVAVAGSGTLWPRMLGVVSLLLAVSLLVLAAVSELGAGSGTDAA